MIKQQKETRPGTAATVRDARQEVHNTFDFTPAGASRQALAVENIIRQIRRHETSAGQIWPGYASEPPRTLYPNLAGEIWAARYFLWCPAGAAGVTEELLADILEAGAELRFGEIARMAGLFRCKTAYLLGSTLQIVNPVTHKGMRRFREVLDAGIAFEAVFGPGENLTDPYYRNSMYRAKTTVLRLHKGFSVTYAEYRRALDDFRDAWHFLPGPKPRRRGTEA